METTMKKTIGVLALASGIITALQSLDILSHGDFQRFGAVGAAGCIAIVIGLILTTERRHLKYIVAGR
jgi:uncharacterized membrane protein HdeD (DUF308 family)